MSNPFFEIMSLKAFTPDPLDDQLPLLRRVRGKRVVLIVYSKDLMELYELFIGDNESVQIKNHEHVTFGAQGSEIKALREFLKKSETDLVAVLLEHGFVVSISEKVKRLEKSSEMLKLMRSRKLVPDKDEAGRFYSVVFHPKVKTSIVFDYDVKVLNTVERLISSAGGKLVRMQCGLANLLSYLCQSKHFENVFCTGCDVCVLSHSSRVHIQVADNGDWQKISPKFEFWGARGEQMLGVFLNRAHTRINKPLLIFNAEQDYTKVLRSELQGLEKRIHTEHRDGVSTLIESAFID